ncbi:hypothetical protein GGR52DRAFT_67603 [Hypoxylon sp. FL1284]|nr:hypothetical protein GGR52DRAFT_67603 [Hypoxylon sp. FL1284]
MSVFRTPALFAALLALSGANAYSPPISGHDFDFSVAYRSGLKFSTAQPPTGVLSAADIVLTEPVVTLADPDSAGRGSRYVAFVEVSYVPTVDVIDDVIYTFPWIESNLTVGDDGALTPDLHTYGASHVTHFDPIETGEVRNATLHVWRQTPELAAFLLDDSFAGLFWQLALVWSNSTDDISYDFARANVDFKIRNDTGEYRGDVDENGASIEGYVPSSTSATTLPTGAPITTGSGSGPASATTGTASPTATPGAAAPPMAVSGMLLLAAVAVAV